MHGPRNVKLGISLMYKKENSHLYGQIIFLIFNVSADTWFSSNIFTTNAAWGSVLAKALLY